MKTHQTSIGVWSILWAILTLFSLGISISLGIQGNNNKYDVITGLRFLTDQPLLVIGRDLLQGLSGVALVFIVVGFFLYVQDGSRLTYHATTAVAFGLMSATLFVISGLIGGHALFDLLYVRQQGAMAQTTNAYLPIMLLINRATAAATSIYGVWLLLLNLNLRSKSVIPRALIITGCVIGSIMLLGLVLPGGGFSLYGLLFATLWAISVGVIMLKKSAVATSTN